MRGSGDKAAHEYVAKSSSLTGRPPDGETGEPVSEGRGLMSDAPLVADTCSLGRCSATGRGLMVGDKGLNLGFAGNWVSKDVHEAIRPAKEGRRQHHVEYFVHGKPCLNKTFGVLLLCLRRAL